MNFKLFFNNLSPIQQLQMYLMPLLILVFVSINYKDIKVLKKEENNHINNEIKTYKNKLQVLKQKKKSSLSKRGTINLYETIAKKLKINILNLEISKNLLTLQYKGKYKNSILYLKAIDKISKIKLFEIIYEDKFIIVNIQINIKYNTNINLDKKEQKENISNPFKGIKTTKVSKAKAIIDNFVMLEGKWYKLNDKYKKATIIKITKNYIVLKNKDKTTILKVFNNE